MSRRNKKKTSVNLDAWLPTYADTVTLLLTFFVLLYSMASVDNEKFNDVNNALKGQFQGQGVMNGSASLGDKEALEGFITNESQKAQVQEQLQKEINEKELDGSIKLKNDERGILLEMEDSILFDSGKTDLRSDSKDMLKEVHEMIKDMKNQIVIEGHTDNVPVGSRTSETNWELSANRAVSVVRYFVEERGMSPNLFSATGYGEYKPIQVNDSSDHRSENRRVNILITTLQEGKSER
ncbi:OmpA/MotB family protein [Metaclostridioides mangenotii]|uniref:OmpA/MotB family protein n=1 Tax=Metaclostridioides mangenotii TaxID=1540 RepID=UPI0004675EF6|nr:OmpA family protein [Clostridioides mangenotii]